VVAGGLMSGIDIAAEAQQIFVGESEPAGLLHLVSMLVVIGTAVAGRHIIEAISWGIIVAFVFNVLFGLASVADMVVFQAPEASKSRSRSPGSRSSNSSTRPRRASVRQ